MVDPEEVRRQDPPHVVAHRRFAAAAARHLAVDLQSSPDCVRGSDYSILDLKREESKRAALDCCCCWQNMAEGGRRCTELGHGLEVVVQQPNRYHGRVHDQDGDVVVL